MYIFRKFFLFVLFAIFSLSINAMLFLHPESLEKYLNSENKYLTLEEAITRLNDNDQTLTELKLCRKKFLKSCQLNKLALD